MYVDCYGPYWWVQEPVDCYRPLLVLQERVMYYDCYGSSWLYWYQKCMLITIVRLEWFQDLQCMPIPIDHLSYVCRLLWTIAVGSGTCTVC